MWHSKRQNVVESSTFGSEFVAFSTASELGKSLRYKLRFFVILFDGPANVSVTINQCRRMQALLITNEVEA